MSAAPFALTAREMADAFGGVLGYGAEDRPLPTVSIDTRTLAPGDLFVAIRGPRFDGHAFVAQAIARGAAGVVVSDPAAVTATDLPVIVVEDTLHGLQEAARVIRRRAGSTVVAITGSAGKTTTKEITATLLGRRFTTFRNRGNLNNHIGLPLSLFELHTAPQFAVMELGMSGVGEISRLVSIAEPQVRVWTNVGEAHLGFFASVDDIALAKQEILEGAGSERRVRRQRRRPTRHRRGPRLCRPGRHVRGGRSGRRDDRCASSRAASTARPRRCRCAATCTRSRPACSAAANLANIAAASAVALVAGIAGRRDRRRRGRPGARVAPRRGRACPGRLGGHRRRLQLEPVGAHACAADACQRAGPARRDARRDARTRRLQRPLSRRMRQGGRRTRRRR